MSRLLTLFITLFAPTVAWAAPAKSGRLEVNGVNYYYEIHGNGEPLLLLHGGLGSIDMFGPLLPALAKTRKVIAVDLHGHGRTALGNRPAGLTPESHALVGVAQEVTRLLGREPELDASSTDANLPMSLGIPAIAIGCGGVAAEMHTANEWYENVEGALGIERALLMALVAAGVGA